MNTSTSVSKTRKRLSTVAALTGSATIIALAIAFVTVDFSGLVHSPFFNVNNSSISALEPICSDAMSEQSGDKNNNNGITGDLNGTTGENGNNNGNPEGGYPEHGLPCLDPNCPVHHYGGNGGGHMSPCEDKDCPICNHQTPCIIPDCPVCNHDRDNCNDPDCPICEDMRPPVDISMEAISFKADSAEYVDSDKALEVLKTYMDSFDVYFDRYPDGKIYLAGGIARVSDWSITDTTLSQMRADKVRQSFIELGVDENRLISIGVGPNDPWRNDEWADGYFNEEIAKTNRRVWIIPDQYSEQVTMIIAVDEMIKSSQ